MTKHLRQLESSDIRLNEISVALKTRCSQPVSADAPLDNFSRKVSTLITLDKAVIPFDDYLLLLPVRDRPLARRVYAAVEAGGVFGVSKKQLTVRFLMKY